LEWQDAVMTFKEFLMENPFNNFLPFEIADARLLEIESHLKTGKEITKLEDNKFLLRKTGDDYSLHRADTNALMGWQKIEIVTEFGHKYAHAKQTYVLKQYRAKDVPLILIRSVKEVLHLPVILKHNDPITPAGKKYHNKMVANKLFKFKTLDMETGIIRPYQSSDIDNREMSIILENDNLGFFTDRYSLPGQPPEMRSYKLFESSNYENDL
jgi:hypothetical protein